MARILEPKSALKSDVSVLLTRVQGTDKDYFNLSISDEKSSLLLLEIKIPWEEVPKLLATTNTYAEGTLHPGSAERFGKELQIKDIQLQIGDVPYAEREQAVNQAADLWEAVNKGWTVDRYLNMRQYDSAKGYYATHARAWV